VKIAAIDIGTNTVLLLIAEVGEDGEIRTLVYEQRVPRLGRGVDAARTLTGPAMDRTVAVLGEYADVIARAQPARTAVCATSAVRDARNREEFCALVYERTGLRVEVLDGEDEALWTYRGAISGLRDVTNSTVIDIGGGSTEITVGDRDRIRRRVSLDIGSVRLTERFFAHDPPDAEERAAARGAVRDALAATDGFAVEGTTLIGVAGTATALAILDRGLPRFEVDAVIAHRLTRERLGVLLERLERLPSSAIRRLSDVMDGRADVITAGAMILGEIMDRFHQPLLVVSERGVRYGLVLREWITTQGTGAA
jgi:exopolyphosphatase/guanosine-5'-triphosphate,3'-diphosphate pyrophosphatase